MLLAQVGSASGYDAVTVAAKAAKGGSMAHRNGAARWTSLVLAAGLAGLTACGPSKEVQRQLAELQTVSAEKDSLLAQVADDSRLMSELSAEVARVQPANAAGVQEVSGTPDRETMLKNIKDMTARVQSSETRLAESQKRIAALSRESKTQQGKLDELQKMVTDFQTTIDNQKQTISSLTEQVNSLQQQNVQLVAQNQDLTTHTTELTQTVADMTARDNTAYYVVGRKDDLVKQGVITEQGGGRVLFVFGKHGKTIVPSRDLDPSTLTKIDRTETTTIPLPDADKQYRIVSLQDLSALSTPPNDKGRLKGEIRIADPDKFWANSKVLIVVQS